MKLQGLIFDVDGTLAETEDLHRQAFNEAFADAGLDWRWDKATYRVLLETAGGKERIDAFQRNHLPGPPLLAWDDIADLHRVKTTRYAALTEQGALSLRPGIAQLVESARRAGLKLAVATTTSRPNLDALCQCCWAKSANKIFDVIAAGDEVAVKKPAPDIYNKALSDLSLGPDACIALEDSRNGMLAAIGAGIEVHVVPSRWWQDDDFHEADHVWLTVPHLWSIIAATAFQKRAGNLRHGGRP